MKHRNGFVSNSSSSSFIIGAAKVLDKEKLTKELEGFGDCKILTRQGLEAYARHRNDYDARYWQGHVIIKAHTNNGEQCWVDLDENDHEHFLLVNVGHDEGDGPFFNEHFYGLDYSIVNRDYFAREYPPSYELLQLLEGKEGLTEPLSYRFGVSRNG